MLCPSFYILQILLPTVTNSGNILLTITVQNSVNLDCFP
jgi:hypothetical protein